MRALIISDIHANLTALEAILQEAKDFDATWCLGDLVGYGPDPNECIELIRTLPNLSCILGNHDSAVINQIDPNSFNPEARMAIQWTKNELSKENKAFLSNLPTTLTQKNVTIAHGSPRHPVWEYLLDPQTAMISFNYFETPFCFVGHTHLPAIFTLENKTDSCAILKIPKPNQNFTLIERSIINPGSVGQPRDKDTRSAFAIYDTENHQWDYRRVTYDIPSVQKRMRKAKLPKRHINRLSAGW